MQIDYVGTAITMVIVALLTWLLRRASLKKPSFSGQGTMILKCSKVFRVFAYIFIGAACFWAFVLAIQESKTLDSVLIWAGLVLLFLALGLWLLFYSTRTWVECDEEKVRFHSMTGKVKEISWRDVSSVKFNRKNLQLSLISRTDRVKVHAHLVGFSTFVDFMKKKLDSQLYNDACREMGRPIAG